MRTCPWCNGTKRVMVMGLYGIARLTECLRCAGSGRV
jgi:hypothetical protein